MRCYESGWHDIMLNEKGREDRMNEQENSKREKARRTVENESRYMLKI